MSEYELLPIIEDSDPQLLQVEVQVSFNIRGFLMST